MPLLKAPSTVMTSTSSWTKFAAKTPDLGVERFDPLLWRNLLVRIRDDLVDGRLLDLDERRARVGQRVVLAVQRGREVHQ
jgi:hypothetical protein